MLYCNVDTYKGASVYSPHKGKISQAYYTRNVIKCRCKSVQKSINLKNAGIVPPPYEVSSAYTEPLDESYKHCKNYIDKGDLKNNRLLKRTFPKCNRRSRLVKPIFRESMQQRYKDTKSLESISYPSETSKKSSNWIFESKKIVDYDRGSKKYNYNPKTRKRGNRLQLNHYLDDVADKHNSMSGARKISLTLLNCKCEKTYCPKGQYEPHRNRCSKPYKIKKNKSQNETANKEIITSNITKKAKELHTKKNIVYPSVICKCIEEKPNLMFEIKPKSIRDKNDTIRQILDPCNKSWCKNACTNSKSSLCRCTVDNRIKHSNKKHFDGDGDVPEWARSKFGKIVCTCEEINNTEKSKMLKVTTNRNETCEHDLCFMTPNQIDHKICKSDVRNVKTKPNESTDTTCNIPKISTTTVRIKNKIICLCHKYSQLLREKERKCINEKNKVEDNRERGHSKNSLVKRKRFTCKCIESPSGNKIMDRTCNLTERVSNYLNKKQLLLQSTKLPTITTEQKPRATYEKGINKDSSFKYFCRCLKYKFTIKKHKSSINIVPQKILSHKNDQTGEPFFEIKVDANNMCVLNSHEIKDKVSGLGTVKKVKSCICPSHVIEKKHFLQKVACSAGLCKNAYIKNNSDFKCKCLSKNIRKCTDVTCDVNFKAKTLSAEPNKPYLEVRLDSDNLCILNSEDIQKKINLLGVACATGICKDAAKDNARYICKCIRKNAIEINECSDVTCGPSVKLESPNKCNSRMVRSKLDTRKLNKIKSKLSFICTCIMSKSDNYTNMKKPKQTVSKTPSDISHEKQSVQIVKEKCHAFGDYRIDEIVGQESSKKNRNIRQKQISNTDYLGSSKLTKCAMCQCNRTKSLWCRSLFSCNKHKFVTNRTSSRRKHLHRRNRLSLPTFIKKTEVKHNHCSCCICGQKKSECNCKRLPKTVRYTRMHMFCESCSALFKKNRKHIKQDDLSVPLKYIKERKEPKSVNEIQRENYYKNWNVNKCLCFKIDKSVLKNRKSRLLLKGNNPQRNQSLKKRNENVCLCSHICQCGADKGKKNIIKHKSNIKKIILKNKVKQHKRKEKRGVHKRKTNQRIAREKRRAFITDEKKLQRQLKKKQKIERKKKEKLFQIEKKQLEAISKGKEEAEETSCLADFFLGLLKCGVAITKKVLFVLFKIVTDPKGSYRYARQRVRDPVGTSERLRKVFTDSWRMKKLKMLRSIGGSEKMTILSDTLQDTAIYRAFSAKGKTKKEKRRIQEQNKKRKRRIRKRDNEALYSCRHMLLHTLRKHPCLCVYHICPNFYPQCLGLLAFMKHFCDILLFLLALIVWTPCILCVEAVRGMMCCLLCTH